KILAFFDEGDFGAELGVSQAEGRGLTGGRNRTPGKDGVQLHAWDGAPVELEGGAGGVHLDRGAVGGAEDVELVMVQVDRNGIVHLEGRALSEEAGDRQEQQKE